MLAQVVHQLSFQEVLLLLLVIGMQVISVSTLIYGINMAYRVIQPGQGNLLMTPEERKQRAAQDRWNANMDRRERWTAERADRRREQRERDFMSSAVDRERHRRDDH